MIRNILLLFCLLPAFAWAQQDSTRTVPDSTKVKTKSYIKDSLSFDTIKLPDSDTSTVLVEDSLQTEDSLGTALRKQKPLSFGYFAAGGGTIDLEAFNDQIENAGLTKVDASFATVGAAYFTTKGRTILGAEGHWYVNQQKNISPAIRARLGGFAATADLGYILSDNRVMLFYPMIGIGIGGLNLGIDSLKSNTFNQYLTNPNASVDMRMRNYLLDANINLLFKIPESPFDYLGFRAGYRYCSSTRWKIDDQVVEGAPKSGLTGTYFEVYIGFNNVKK